MKAGGKVVLLEVTQFRQGEDVACLEVICTRADGGMSKESSEEGPGFKMSLSRADVTWTEQGHEAYGGLKGVVETNPNIRSCCLFISILVHLCFITSDVRRRFVSLPHVNKLGMTLTAALKLQFQSNTSVNAVTPNLRLYIHRKARHSDLRAWKSRGFS